MPSPSEAALSSPGETPLSPPAWWQSGAFAVARPLLQDQTGQTACRLILAGHLCGTFLMYNDVLRVIWMALLLPIAFVQLPWGSMWRCARPDAFRAVALYFMCWMTIRSLLAYGLIDGREGLVAGGWLLGGLLLAFFAIAAWQVAAEGGRKLDALGLWTGFSAAFAALVSLVLHYVVLTGHTFGERLTNVFVHGGLNAVSTGLTFGFAATWLICLRPRITAPRTRLFLHLAVVVLLIAVCFTRSRGALLAVLAAYAALTWVQGLRKTRLPWTLLISILLAFHFSGPLVEQIAQWQMEHRAPTSTEDVFSSHTAAPVHEMILRRDNGRFEIYTNAISALAEPHEWLIGVGQWGPAEFCTRSVARRNLHHHSAFFATFVHGGLIGLGLLLTLLAIGLRRAHSVAAAGDPTWFVLILFGCAGLLFDGQTFATLLSMPQMETLLVTFPLIVAASLWWHARERAVGRQNVSERMAAL